MSPGGTTLFRMLLDIDVRHVLASVRAPTLVLHRAGDLVTAAAGRDSAEHIPGARYVDSRAPTLPLDGGSNRSCTRCRSS